MLRQADGREAVEAVCLRNGEVEDWHVLRAMSIAGPMMEHVVGWIAKHDIDVLEVCLESPVYNNNAAVLMVQMSLYTVIQMYVFDYLTPFLDKLYLTIVNNRTSKRLLAHDGKADKKAMIAASPWAERSDITYNQKHTLADSYAHSLAEGRQQWALHRMKPYAVEVNYVERR